MAAVVRLGWRFRQEGGVGAGLRAIFTLGYASWPKMCFFVLFLLFNY